MDIIRDYPDAINGDETNYFGGKEKKKKYKGQYNGQYTRPNTGQYTRPDNGYGGKGNGKGISTKLQLNEIDQEEYVYKHLSKTSWYHLSREPIHDPECYVNLQPVSQMYINSWNAMGRPEGIWCALGNEWIRRLHENPKGKFDQFTPPCCYVYEVKVSPDISIALIHSKEDLETFHKDFATYWIDYNQVDTNRSLISELLYDSNKDLDVYYKSLIEHEFITEDYETACKIYSNAPEGGVNRIKAINWHRVSQQFDGVFFDYKKNMLKTYNWFDGLDLQSACIWNLDKMSFILDSIKTADHTWGLVKDKKCYS